MNEFNSYQPLINKQGKIVNIMMIKCMADCLSSDHFSMSYITDAAATMDTMTPVKNVPLVCDGSIFDMSL